MNVQDLMSSPVFCVRANDDLGHARKELLRHDISQLPVVDATGTLRGMLSLSDLVYPRPGEAWLGSAPAGRVDSRMARGVRTLAPDTPDLDAAHFLLRHKLSCVPVTAHDVVVGVVSTHDLLKAWAPRSAGRLQVRDLQRPRLPSVPRHASATHVLKLMRDEGVREVAVTEGQAFPTERPAPTSEALRDPVHRGRTSAAWGILGLIDLKSVVGSAWFGAPSPASAPEKRLAEARRSEAAGTKRLRHIEVVGAVAEDMMRREVSALAPEDDAAAAVRLFLETGVSGLPVLGPGARPGFLDRQDLLEGLAQRLSP